MPEPTDAKEQPKEEKKRGLPNVVVRFMTAAVGIPIFQPLEVQMMMAAFTNMETVHIDAYALLLKTLGMPQAEAEHPRPGQVMSW